MKNKYDVIIVGNGVAGLFAALHLSKEKEIAIITKGELEECDSFLAQGGICVLKNEDDYIDFFEDTLRAGHYENNREAVDLMIRSSQDVIKELVDFGVDFERKHGDFVFTREGGHTTFRILHHEDLTGKEITSKLLEAVMKRKNISLFVKTTMVDIIENQNTCYGVIVDDNKGNVKPVFADYTIWACGGIGGLYEHSTNYPQLTGDALAISLKHNIALENIDYVQIHPTILYSKKPGRRILISESVRGEGAILLNKAGERFADELLPRDLLTEKIRKQMELDGTDFVYLSLENMEAEEIIKRFPNIYQYCLEEGYDITKEPIPVVPAQHYFMGGVKVDLDGKTSMNRLYSAGETACNGVHGANRLASNSLLESLVWAKNAAVDIMKHYEKVDFDSLQDKELLLNNKLLPSYQMVEADYHDSVRREIEKEHNKRINK
ncbi:MAG: L-aspartate oxidase [Lachnospiraceae bacterium]